MKTGAGLHTVFFRVDGEKDKREESFYPLTKLHVGPRRTAFTVTAFLRQA